MRALEGTTLGPQRPVARAEIFLSAHMFSPGLEQKRWSSRPRTRVMAVPDPVCRGGSVPP